MSKEPNISKEEYSKILTQALDQIRSARNVIAQQLNSAKQSVYWNLGKLLFEKQLSEGYGSGVVNQLSIDLKCEFPDMGLSPRNLWDMKRFYERYHSADIILRQAVAVLPWGHNLLLINKVMSLEAVAFYANETVTKGWSRDILLNAIKIDSFSQAKTRIKSHNFEQTLTTVHSDYANENTNSMKKLITLFLTLFISLSVIGQTEKVKGNLSSIDTADLTILNIYPDSFPNVSVVFKAETRKGEPVWNLTKEKMKVKENSQNCEVISLEQISKNKPINLGIVIDHSGSMMDDIDQLYDKNGVALYSFDANFNPIYPKGYTSPIDNAKTAVKSFVTSFDSKKDYISITGFSNTVDRKLPLTQNIGEINSIVDSMQADFSTALYDAMIASIDEIKISNGVKVLVVLTDGQDNSSKSKWNDVVDKAIKEDIPIYIIGLGNVNKDTLQLIAKSTKGKFYFTQSSTSLNTVYAAISKQVQAFYNLVYSSPNFSSADSTRQIELSFDIDSIFLVTNPATINFPSEVLAFIEKKEKQKEYLLYAGIGTAILVASGSILFYYRRKKKVKPIIKNLFPNPSNGIINLDFFCGGGQLQIVNLSGQVAKTIEINSDESQFDISDLQDGNYIAIIQSNGQQSNAIKFILQR